MRYLRTVAAGMCALLVMFAGGCGGGSSSTGSVGVSVAISPTNVTVGFGTAVQFAATVSGSSNTAVAWSVNGTTGGSAQTGTISSTGLYSAPSVGSLSSIQSPQTVSIGGGATQSGVNVIVPQLNSTNSVTVTATSQADSSKSGSASVTLSGLSMLAVGNCPINSTQCSASATGAAISRSEAQPVYLFIVGYGIAFGTFYSISGNGTDVVVTQPTTTDFLQTTNGYPAVLVTVTVSPTATLGPRNLVVTNANNELCSFPGGVDIVP